MWRWRHYRGRSYFCRTDDMRKLDIKSRYQHKSILCIIFASITNAISICLHLSGLKTTLAAKVVQRWDKMDKIWRCKVKMWWKMPKRGPYHGQWRHWPTVDLKRWRIKSKTSIPHSEYGDQGLLWCAMWDASIWTNKHFIRCTIILIITLKLSSDFIFTLRAIRY